MIDIADFAVGQSRMLYGLQMHSERPGHRMYEQWHPLGVVGVISAFNFPVAVWSWNAFLAAICGDVGLEAVAQDRRSAPSPCRRSATDVLAQLGLPDRSSSCSSTTARPRGEVRRGPARRRSSAFTGSTAVGRKVGAARCEARSAAACSSSAATTRSSSTSSRTSTWSCRLSCSARSARPASAARRRAACSCTSRASAELERRLVGAYRQVRIGDPLAMAR
jgi:aldehyde dehydrogenase (NAD+)